MNSSHCETHQQELPDGASFLRALWGFEVRVRALPAAANEYMPRRPRFMTSNLWLPASPLSGVPGSFNDYCFAACAHISAHLRFGAPRFPIGSLKPAQIAIVSLLEDARVERLASAHYPGLQRLWAPYHEHEPRAAPVKTSSSLFARLARALHDDSYVDDDSWVKKGRQLFLQGRAEWHDANLSRRIGSALGNDLGQMRVQFNSKEYAVQPAYRDDNGGLWQFEREQSEDGTQLEAEAEAGRRVESDMPAAQQRERGEPKTSQVLDASASERASGGRAASIEVHSGTRHPEWDYVIQRERPGFCTVLERPVADGPAARVMATLSGNAPARKRLERAALQLANRRQLRVRRLLDGDRLDLPAAVATIVARASGAPPDPRVYRRVRFQRDPPSLLLLLDLSESLNAFLPGTRSTLLELAYRASALLATSLASVAGDLAIHGFSSNGRHDVGYYRFKDFDQPYDDRACARLAGMHAHLSTRLGSALRHAGQTLARRSSARKLLLVVTDGEPSDIDVHDPKYLLFDAKQAAFCNRRLGVTSFCIGLDPNAKESVQRIFGDGNYSLLDQLERLPERLTQLYLRLSSVTLS
ncbi:MAG TPA: VWA domain-containing protein [Polyangiaceae bacterium]|nr:VWA domain-containing protein [Polyangiaceae bacterium]